MKNLILILSIVLLGASGCASEGCYEESESDLIILLFETDTEENLPVDSLTVYGLGMSNVQLYTEDKESYLSLPLFAASLSSSFVLINGTFTDTIEVTYTGSTSYISKECGYRYDFIIENVYYTKHRIDTVLIIDNIVTTADEENLRTFFKSDNILFLP